MWLAIGEKLKLQDSEAPERPTIFDDDYFAELIMQQEDNLEFFGNSVIQNIIDYQFEKQTKWFMQGVFYLYLFFFCCPYLLTLVYDDPVITTSVFKVCVLPQYLLLCIEVVQIYEVGVRAYTADLWNMVDLMQIVMFQVLY
jgi:hypothetical protein